jgi:transcription factor Ssl1
MGWGEENGGGGAECPNAAADAACFACCTPLQEAVSAGDAALRRNVVLRCGRCTQLFCVECDLLIHDALHNCPGCEFASTGRLPAT